MAITAGIQRASLSALLTTATAAYRWDWVAGAGGTFYKLGSPTQKTITHTAVEGATAADRTPAQVWRRILIERCGVDAGRISAADVAAVAAAAPWEVSGLWQGEAGGTRRELLDRAAGAAGARWWVDGTGLYRIRKIAAPGAAAPAAVLRITGRNSALATGELELQAFSWQPAGGDTLWGVPPSALTLTYGPNLTVQDDSALATGKGDPADAVGAARRDWLARASRQVRVPGAGDPQVLSAAQEVTVDSAIRDPAAAGALAPGLLALLSAITRPATATLFLTQDAVGTIGPGDWVAVHYPDYGIEDAPFLVMEADYAFDTDIMTLALGG